MNLSSTVKLDDRPRTMQLPKKPHSPREITMLHARTGGRTDWPQIQLEVKLARKSVVVTETKTRLTVRTTVPQTRSCSITD